MNEHNDILKALRQQMEGENNPAGYPFRVPPGYFSGIDSQVLTKVLADDRFLAEAPLAEEGKKQTFTVPDGYFDNLETQLLKKTATTPVVRMLFPKRWRQIAAAAITALLILSGIYYWEGSNRQQITVQNKTNSHPVIRSVSVTELADFVEEGTPATIGVAEQKNSVDINQLFQKISSQDLENFLNESAASNTELF